MADFLSSVTTPRARYGWPIEPRSIGAVATPGNNRAGGTKQAENVSVVCFDTETGPIRTGNVRWLADEMGASYHQLDELEPWELSEAVRGVFGGSYGS